MMIVVDLVNAKFFIIFFSLRGGSDSVRSRVRPGRKVCSQELRHLVRQLDSIGAGRKRGQSGNFHSEKLSLL
jgi:hypothetical protein